MCGPVHSTRPQSHESDGQEHWQTGKVGDRAKPKTKEEETTTTTTITLTKYMKFKKPFSIEIQVTKVKTTKTNAKAAESRISGFVCWCFCCSFFSLHVRIVIVHVWVCIKDQSENDILTDKHEHFLVTSNYTKISRSVRAYHKMIILYLEELAAPNNVT